MLEEHTGRTVQLGNNHTLCAVNHKRTARGHQRNFAHIHFVFTNFFYRRFRRFLIQNHQTDTRAQRGSISDSAQLTFRDIEQRLAQRVIYKLQTSITVVAHNRENRIKCRLQTVIGTFVKSIFQLQKFRIRINLGCQ
ncbi:Uncharacterised protein [Neisseria gonorrhoeae]|nr:Uncharacterised protein [Neisseria gonorrhoeae]CNQ04818.1 Uncharacterised protein [Neisseria gonorrhoeae]CNR60099.1 Uncharacterised protein [Neisseria gonorrhoeae]CNS53312.1 Uncharacterised protein [Neisseria gonorrhoeae]